MNKTHSESDTSVQSESEEDLYPLHTAAENDDLDKINQLLDEDADINGQDAEGNTPLMVAIYEGKRAAVKLLMNKGADFEKIENFDRSTAQELAQEYNMSDIVR
jgi:ankyrin repeat protein